MLGEDPYAQHLGFELPTQLSLYIVSQSFCIRFLSMSMFSAAAALSLEQKCMLYRDGYIILEKVVSKELVQAALLRIRAARKG